MNTELYNAFELSAEQYISDSVPDMPDHVFSKRFERKIRRLRKIADSTPMPKVTLKKLPIYIAAAILAALLAVTAGAGKFFKNFIMEIFDTHTDVTADFNNNAPDTIKDIYSDYMSDSDNPQVDFKDKYEITADLKGFELDSMTEDIFERQRVYKNPHCIIIFTQKIKKYYDMAVNTEGYKIETVTINGNDGFYIDMYKQNAKYLTWDNGDYIFILNVICDNNYNINKNDIIETAESVQKAE